LLHPQLPAIIDAAHSAGIHAIHVETDLNEFSPGTLPSLAASDVDVVSVHIPALSPACYETVMGTNALPRVLDNIKTFILHRQSFKRGVPLLVPVFTKCQQNLAEMETWYDQWLKAL